MIQSYSGSGFGSRGTFLRERAGFLSCSRASCYTTGDRRGSRELPLKPSDFRRRKHPGSATGKSDGGPGAVVEQGVPAMPGGLTGEKMAGACLTRFVHGGSPVFFK